MKLSVLLFFLGIFVGVAQIDKTDLEIENLKSSVKSVRSISYIALVQGQDVEKQEVYFGKEALYKNTLSVYDGKNKVQYREFDSDGNLLMYVQRYFNNKGHRSETIECDAYEEPLYIRTHTCDELGRVVLTKVCAANEDYCLRNIYYDYSKPNTKIVTWENDQSENEGSYIVLYDAKNNKIREEKKTANGSTDYVYTYAYDAQNRLISQAEDALTTYTYNDKGDVASQKICKEGNCIEQKYTYTYDSRGNWTKRITYINQKPTIITERQIQYL